MNALCAKFSLVFDNVTPFADTVYTENKECNALFLKNDSSKFAASVPALKSPLLFRKNFAINFTEKYL